MDGVVSLITSTPEAEIIEANAKGVCFRGHSPLRTFIIIREGDLFRVKETTGWQTAGRNNEPSAYSDRDIITESQMMGWVSARLKELRAI